MRQRSRVWGIRNDAAADRKYQNQHSSTLVTVLQNADEWKSSIDMSKLDRRKEADHQLWKSYAKGINTRQSPSTPKREVERLRFVVCSIVMQSYNVFGNDDGDQDDVDDMRLCLELHDNMGQVRFRQILEYLAIKVSLFKKTKLN